MSVRFHSEWWDSAKAVLGWLQSPSLHHRVYRSRLSTSQSWDSLGTQMNASFWSSLGIGHGCVSYRRQILSNDAAVNNAYVSLTLSVPHFFWLWIPPKRSAPYWSSPPFLIFWHSGTLAFSPERQSARMSKKLKVGLDQYGPNTLKCNRLTPLALKGLISVVCLQSLHV